MKKKIKKLSAQERYKQNYNELRKLGKSAKEANKLKTKYKYDYKFYKEDFKLFYGYKLTTQERYNYNYRFYRNSGLSPQEAKSLRKQSPINPLIDDLQNLGKKNDSIFSEWGYLTKHNILGQEKIAKLTSLIKTKYKLSDNASYFVVYMLYSGQLKSGELEQYINDNRQWLDMYGKSRQREYVKWKRKLSKK